MRRPKLLTGLIGGSLAIALVGLLATTAAATSSAPPKQTSNPTLKGPWQQPFVGDSLTVSNGGWSGNPTKYSYQWKRCDAVGDRQNCAPITGATSSSYKIQKADANHKLDAIVTASNADGSASSDASSGVVADNTAPTNKTHPAISGSASVGSTLAASDGSWLGASSFSYAWQQCDQNGNACADIAGATGKSYGVRSSDVGHELRLQVTATNKYGSAHAYSNLTTAVTANTTTTVVTTTVAGNKAPTIRFLSLKRVGQTLYARFYVCDDSTNRLKIIERDNKARALSYTRRFTVTPCATYTRHWLLLRRYRSHGRLVVTLRAQDSGGRLSLLASRSITIR